MGSKRARAAVVLFAIGSFAFSLAACGSDDDTSGTGGTSAGGSGGSGATAGKGGSASGGEAGGGACVGPNGSCVTAECCSGLQCCSGVPIPDGQAVCYAECPDSDRNLKQDFQPVDANGVLESVSALPITTWSYKAESNVRHIGPMAQDFKAKLAVGGSDRAIHKVDADGVALASIQALHARVLKLEAENTKLRSRLEKLESKRR